MNADRRFWLYHLLVPAIAVAVWAAEIVPDTAVIWGFVVTYNAGWAWLCWRRPQPRLFRQWLFLAVLGALQIFPDWFLVEGLDVLRFADHSPSAGPVPLYLAGFWAFPLVVTTYVGHRARTRFGALPARFTVALLALLVFGLGEFILTKIPIWTPHNVQTIGGVALYILPAEIFLAATVFEILEFQRPRHRTSHLLPAGLVMIGYLGAAGLSYLLVENVFQISV